MGRAGMPGERASAGAQSMQLCFFDSNMFLSFLFFPFCTISTWHDLTRPARQLFLHTLLSCCRV